VRSSAAPRHSLRLCVVANLQFEPDALASSKSHKSTRTNRSNRPVALTIAGSDPGGGAGIQADLKTFAALGVYGFSALTSVIAQNSSRIKALKLVKPAMLEAQLEVLAAECIPDAVKTGAMGNYENVKAVAKMIARLKMPAPVVDPVTVASNGARLLGPKGERAMRKHLIPIARVVTPNIP
jgi:hydroxymethylpyrimidine/phosphomethylpyrimidine kinase